MNLSFKVKAVYFGWGLFFNSLKYNPIELIQHHPYNLNPISAIQRIQAAGILCGLNPYNIISDEHYIAVENDLRTLRSVESVTDERDKNKVCVNCGNTSTQIAIFDVGGASQIERYCDSCVKLIKLE